MEHINLSGGSEDLDNAVLIHDTVYCGLWVPTSRRITLPRTFIYTLRKHAVFSSEALV
jgi:hypothetical protein